jgi:hypothetical protein
MSSTVAIAFAVLFLAVLLLPLIGILTRDALVKKSGTGLLMGIGLFVLFVGERVFGEGDWRVPVSLFGLAIVLGAVGLRFWAWKASSGGRREGHQLALGWSAVTVASLLFYALSLPFVTNALGLDEAATARWQGVWGSIFPIVTVLGLLPTLRLDQLLASHPIVMPAGAASAAQIHGVTAALAIALMFPVNYLAKQHEKEVDVAYFRTTRPGESVLSLVSTLTEPLEVILFFPSGSEVASELRPYFTQLADQSGGKLNLRVVDQAFDPKLAEDLKVRENGQIVLKQGDKNEKFKLDLDMDKAKRDLRKLDSLVQKHLLKLTRGAGTVYFLAGHGEANWRDNEDPFRKINVFKKDILEPSNLKVKTLGVADGSTTAVPDDAAMVIVAAPSEPLLPEEIDTLKKYWDQGGALYVLLSPKSDPMTDLLAHVGLESGTAPLANAEAHARLFGGLADNVLIGTNKYGSHPSVKTLSRNSQVAHMVLPGAVFVQKKGEGAGSEKVTTLVRSMPNTWEDTDGNFLASEGEAKKVYELAVAVTKEVEADGEKKEARALVVGSVGVLADGPIVNLKANEVFPRDGIMWLNHDEEIAGDVESEEDVKVQHTRQEDWMWFLTAIVAVPAMVLGAGVMFIRFRGGRSS